MPLRPLSYQLLWSLNGQKGPFAVGQPACHGETTVYESTTILSHLEHRAASVGRIPHGPIGHYQAQFE